MQYITLTGGAHQRLHHLSSCGDTVVFVRRLYCVEIIFTVENVNTQ